MISDVVSCLGAHYPMTFSDAELIRDWIGRVYCARSGERKYAFKMFAPRMEEAAKASIAVMAHLKRSGVSVPEIYPCVSGDMWFFHEGRVCALMEFIDGVEVENMDFRLAEKARLWGNIMSAMRAAPVDIPVHGRGYFVDRYLNIMERKGYPRRGEFARIGDALWKLAEKMPRGFVHGDFHAGNLFCRDGALVAYDFDACAEFTPLYDVTAMCDATDYFSLEEKNFTQGREKTLALSAAFLKESTVGAYDISVHGRDILALVALRHFDIQATIIEKLGLDCVDEAFLDNQLTWLKKWLKVCEIE